jgi:nucleotide-binding universal stress UspA family protein
MSRLRRILHPTDFSRASGAAFARALAMAKADRAELVVLHVLSAVQPALGEGYISPRTVEAIEASARGAGEKGLKRLVARAKKAGVRARALVREGIPHAEIIRAAERQRADLIVIGTHGRTGLARMLLGSVAARVVSLAQCPVLTVRGR